MLAIDDGDRDPDSDENQKKLTKIIEIIRNGEKIAQDGDMKALEIWFSGLDTQTKLELKKTNEIDNLKKICEQNKKHL